MQSEHIEKYRQDLNELLPKTPPLAKKIACPSCQQETPASNINIDDKIAKCNSCHTVFSFQKDINSLLIPQNVKQEIVKPEGIDIFQFRDDLDITIQQPYLVLEIVSLIFPFFAILFTFIFFVGKKPIWPIFPIVSWILSIPSIVLLFTHHKHKLHITVDKEYISVMRRPKKFTKDKIFPVREVDQLYIKNVDGYYAVFMTVNSIEGQKHVKLITGTDTLSKARYLEQEIERHLNIVDRPVPEEIK